MLKYRLISFPLLLLLAFTVVFWQPYGRIIFMVIAPVLALAVVWESCNLVRKIQLPVHSVLALLVSVLLLAKYGYASVFPEQMRYLPGLPGILVFVFTVLMLKTLFCREQNKLLAAAGAFVTPGVVLFAMLPVIALVGIYLKYGALIFLALVLATKASDTGGYIVGMLSNKLMKGGNHKIVPTISPKKSWEGTVGAAFFSIGTTALLVHFNCISLSVANIFIFGFLAFLGSFAGDLTESQLKRVAGIKDSADWIPGMGGILDVLDSFIYNAPLFYLALESGVVLCQ
ncbi:MAG: hypothetical protein E7039_07665 [Lentisphaerae bacterium]|nr:hypothetical protein [Lentisphaerota bacterium]